ncbi:MAG TPA: glutamate--tRNA ligase family protein [Verrucomicrobiae bacterium]|jgi:glutamyl-tRNA synthetase|nr:glutamate--tRNA ligase family protein [Verrucomicrobiae bacterium]
MSVRVRFAPSPTGYLHIGGARTALFNWLYARHTGGTFILRIEDTDAARNTREATEVILKGLSWLGLDWDEGPATPEPTGPSRGDFGPYFQSQRGAIYQRRVQELKDKGMAYESEGAVKFRMERAPIVIPDLIVGGVTRELTDREQADPDFVIIRSDGQPVFHFVNVVDDLEMKITHVIRGEDHLSNTAKHIALFRAFGVEPPHYAHIPLILNPDGAKMSKRDVGASLQTYMDDGDVPEAVVNYLCLLGWSPKENREKLPLPEIIQRFDLPQIHRNNARFDIDKLRWLGGEYIREMPRERFREMAITSLKRAGCNLEAYPADYINAAVATCEGKIKRFGELPAYAGFYFTDDIQIDPALAAKEFTPESKPRLQKLRDAFAQLPDFTAAEIEKALKSTAAQLGIKAGPLVHPTRLACTGNPSGPSLYHLLEILSKETVLKRIDKVLAQA